MVRPLADFVPRERLAGIPHTTRRFSCRSALAIAPDARAIAFAADLGAGTYEAHTLPLGPGGRPQRVLQLEGGAVRSLTWSLSGELVGAADRGGTELHQLYVRHPDGPVAPLSVDPDARVQRLLSWNAASPDGRTVAFSSNAREPADMDIVLVPLDGGPERRVVSGSAWHVAGGWSPDGRSLSVMRVLDNTTQELLAVDVASGATRQVTVSATDVQHIPAGWLADGRVALITDEGSDHLWLGALDLSSGKIEVIDKGDWDVELAVSSQDGHVQVWSVNVDGYSHVKWRRDGRHGGERDLKGVCADLIVSSDGSLAAFARQSATEAWQLWVLDTATGDARMVLAATVAIPPMELVEPELLRVAAADGPIPVFVYWPRGARGRVPAVLYPHGGPEGQSRPALAPNNAHLAALVHRGIAVVVPNIHGSTGYGRKWQAAIHRDWGGIDLRDLRAVADWMGAHERIAPERLAVYGGSYGGFAALLCVTQLQDRWKCAVDLFGVANLVTMLENAPPNWRRFNARWIGDLATERAKLTERSPITHMDAVRCPMLVLQGTNDPRVPKVESDQVVDKLRSLGRRVEYVVFEDEGHGFTKRANADQAYQRIVDFLVGELQPL